MVNGEKILRGLEVLKLMLMAERVACGELAGLPVWASDLVSGTCNVIE